MTLIVAVGLWVRDDGKVLAQQRPATSLRGGLWEFPGGKVESGETMYKALQREWMEELSLSIEVGKLIDEQMVSFPDIEAPVLLPLFEVRAPGGQEITPLDGQLVEWVTLDEVMQRPGTPTMPLYEQAVRRHLDYAWGAGCKWVGR